MASSLLVRLTDVLALQGGESLFAGVSLNIHRGDRIALVGRNGSGKSTIANLIAGKREADSGTIWVSGGVSIGYLEQAPAVDGYKTLGDFVVSALRKESLQSAQKAAAGLGFDPDIATADASGGEIRRAAIAALLVGEPNVMILDEPTNHLDIEAIIWIEERLKQTKSAFLLISHDRTMLRTLCRRTVWIDRGRVRQTNLGFNRFEDWRDQIVEEDNAARHRLEQKINSETRWSVEGISARRRRNQGRLRQLQRLREERRRLPNEFTFGKLGFSEDASESRLILEAKNLSKRFDDKSIARDFSLLLRRGDRIAFAGPNGCGKTTMLRMLQGDLNPDSGKIRFGLNTRSVEYRQIRCGGAQHMSVREYLAGDGARARDRLDRISIGGRSRHVVSYLKDFLFTDSQVNAPLGSLSGGERARLELARIMARPSNLLILDEPTNDLDLETLDLLQEVISEYRGAVLLASHDRDFLDRVVTATVVCEGHGKWTGYAGGWSDRFKPTPPSAEAVPRGRNQKKPSRKPSGAVPSDSRLSFTEAFRLAEVENLIPAKEKEISELADAVSRISAGFAGTARFEETCAELAAQQSNLEALEMEWFRLAEKAENSASPEGLAKP